MYKAAYCKGRRISKDVWTNVGCLCGEERKDWFCQRIRHVREIRQTPREVLYQSALGSKFEIRADCGLLSGRFLTMHLRGEPRFGVPAFQLGSADMLKIAVCIKCQKQHYCEHLI